MFTKNLTKRTWILIGVYFATAVIAIFMLKDTYREPFKQQEVLLPQGTNKPAPAKGAAQAGQEYTKLVNEYKDRRIQFDINCQAVPSNITYKNGTKVMFDNRSGDARIITVDGVRYNFSGYGYKTLTLSSSTLPKNILLSCGSAVNVGQILLQK